jgi:ferrous iron transport protein B
MQRAEHERCLTIALAGNANVGKSVIFNQLTGLNQIVGNWPGKTVERAEGTLHFKEYTFKVLDLPGIYSLSTYSIEEIVARDYIAIERPDIIINVVDASALERNLYFTLQLLELEAPIVMALNQVDFASKRGIEVDAQELSQALGIQVIPTVAVSGVGIDKLLSTVVDIHEGKVELKPLKVRYGKEIEERLDKIEGIIRERLPELSAKYPTRWIAIKLLERDEDIEKKVRSNQNGGEALEYTDTIIEEIERLHGEPSSVVIASERYRIVNSIARDVTRVVSPPKTVFEEKLDAVTAHKVLGYPVLIAVMAATFAAIFVAGDFLVGLLDRLFSDMLIPIIAGALSTVMPQAFVDLIAGGFLSGISAGVTIALPYIVPFYIILAVLEDSGYLPRAAFLMDSVMHKIGLHGKAFIPLLLGYGCSVPACIGCRIMETDRERFLAGLVVVLVPCAARTVVILGLVGSYVGLPAALALYLFDLVLVFALGRLAFRVLPGEPVGLIMEMPPYKMPSLKNVGKKTWARTKDFIYIAFPLIIGGSIVLELLRTSGLAWSIADIMAPFINGWLGLPAITGIPLIFGILRKELTLILLSELAGTTDFSSILSPLQMVVFALVTMIYVPCVATIAALVREFGWKRAVGVVVIDILLALLIGGVAHRILVAYIR